MLRTDTAPPHVFTVEEIARAADVPVDQVRSLLDAEVHGGFVSYAEATRLVRVLLAPVQGRPVGRPLFAPARQAERRTGIPLAASGALHAALLAAIVLLTSLGARAVATGPGVPEPTRLVFLATPGPGGGGGGGGLRQPLAPPKAQLKGESRLRSPVAVARTAERRTPEKPVEPPRAVPEARPDPEPPPVQATPVPPVTAPVVSAAADASDEVGLVTETAASLPSHGSGSDDGAGSGRGGGSGEGDGTGIGEGSVAGTGGGPYRPGSGITPPGLQREVKPVYTEEGRRRGVEGEVLMEVVVRADGTVGAVRLLRGLGAGLDQSAADAVRKWIFSPARRFGTPVDVLVEIAVEFRLR